MICATQYGGGDGVWRLMRGSTRVDQKLIIHYLPSDTVRYRPIFKLKKNLNSTHERE